MQAWREYARLGLQPAYAWADASRHEAPALLRASGSTVAMSSRLRLEISAAFEDAQGLVGQAGAIGTLPAVGGAAGQPPSARISESNQFGIGSNVVASSLSASLAGGGDVRISALAASQRYATSGFGLGQTAGIGVDSQALLLPQEQSAGQGARLDYVMPVGADWQWAASVQSRIDMDPFQSYRGVYAEPGEFDLPARAGAQLRFSPTAATTLTVGAERVFFGDVKAFTSLALPPQLLGLLGDGSSPTFAWEDLTVYTLEGTVRDATDGLWSLRYTSRQQPAPTSALLRMALEDSFTDLNLALGYQRDLGSAGALSFAAAYAPSRYFLGLTPSGRRYQDGSQVEFEASWTLAF
jgi:hypothetical protein